MTPQMTNGTSDHQGMLSQPGIVNQSQPSFNAQPYSSEQYPKQSPSPATPSLPQANQSATNRQPPPAYTSSQQAVHPTSTTTAMATTARASPAQSAHPLHQPANSTTQVPSSSSYGYNTPSSTPRAMGVTIERGTGAFYQPPKPVEVYHLPDHIQSSIPAEVTSQFHCDDQGRILFFTAPPLDTLRPYKPGQAVGHSVRYLAEKARRAEALEKKRKTAEMESAVERDQSQKRQKTTDAETDQQELSKEISNLKQKSLEVWNRQLKADTESLYKNLYGENGWREGLICQLERVAKG